MRVGLLELQTASWLTYHKTIGIGCCCPLGLPLLKKIYISAKTVTKAAKIVTIAALLLIHYRGFIV